MSAQATSHNDKPIRLVVIEDSPDGGARIIVRWPSEPAEPVELET